MCGRNSTPTSPHLTMGQRMRRRNASAASVVQCPLDPEVTFVVRSDDSTDYGNMAIFSVYVVNKAGGLIYQLDNQSPRSETEKTFSFPLDLVLKVHDERVLVSFGQRDGIKVGHAILSINGIDVNGRYTAEGKEVLEYLGAPPPTTRSPSALDDPGLLPMRNLCWPPCSTRELFAIGSQLSPEPGSSGIEMLETDTFKLHCFQTLTGEPASALEIACDIPGATQDMTLIVRSSGPALGTLMSAE
ncbi:unnamed protein product [Ranitomeya imitator]|uniref:Trafficking protein particle complex subunit n=1 Tax=Ranitomeya imitator TaxID=111125 RepID=A0ABN9LXI4_9NEOB|nr:unnamed protein product [Ranitomeya imitator]